jgi:uncharacterized protein
MSARKIFVLLFFATAIISGCKQQPNIPQRTTSTPTPSQTPSPVDSSILIPAAAAGDIVKVTQLIADGADVNVRGASGNTPLMEAAYGNHPEVARLLLEKGANIALKKNDGATAISFAADGNHKEISEMLDQVDRLIAASGRGELETVTALLDKGAIVNGRGEGGRSALMEAAFGQHVPVVKLLLDRGADVNAKKEDGATALSISRGTKNQRISAMLIEKGAK